MDLLLYIGIGLFLVVDALFVLGLIYVLRRRRQTAGSWASHVASADHALEQARAADRGWDRGVMDAVAHAAVVQTRPGWSDFDLELGAGGRPSRRHRGPCALCGDRARRGARGAHDRSRRPGRVAGRGRRRGRFLS